MVEFVEPESEEKINKVQFQEEGDRHGCRKRIYR